MGSFVLGLKSQSTVMVMSRRSVNPGKPRLGSDVYHWTRQYFVYTFSLVTDNIPS